MLIHVSPRFFLCISLMIQPAERGSYINGTVFRWNHFRRFHHRRRQSLAVAVALLSSSTSMLWHQRHKLDNPCHLLIPQPVREYSRGTSNTTYIVCHQYPTRSVNRRRPVHPRHNIWIQTKDGPVRGHLRRLPYMWRPYVASRHRDLPDQGTTRVL